MGVILKKLGHLETAKVYYEKSIKANPDYPYGYFNLAIVYAEAKAFETAVKIITEGINQNEEIAVLYYNRGCYNTRLNKYNEALQDILKAIEIDNNLVQYMKQDKELDALRNLEAYKVFFDGEN